jgi:spore coat polysaccharide biosynthesis protein SpsF (cytidylyltransferase family)|tara:strand:+ start:1574 stop:2236 length:663 start_codon:yes stop_codon:yes gene_type:complete
MIIAIQARSDSKRFPNKIFQKINNKTILENIIDNLKKLNLKIYICSTSRKIDRKIQDITEKNNCVFFAGNKNNVLKRLYECAKKNNADWLIRINGDSPLISAHIIKKAMNYKKKFTNFDIITNVFVRTFPKGMSVEIIKTECLKKLNLMNLSKINREHVTKYIYQNPNLFKIKNFKSLKNYSSVNLSVDTKKDLKFVKKKIHIFKNVNSYKKLIYQFKLL